MEEPITLSEKIYMLGIHPEKGGIIASAYSKMDIILIGAVLLELWQNGHVEFENKRLILRNAKSKDRLHTFLLNKIRVKEKPLKISRWISKFSNSKRHIRRSVQARLVDKKVIRLENKRFLFFKWKKPILIRKQVTVKLISNVQNQVFGGETTSDDLLFLSLVKPAGLLKRLFLERAKRKKAKKQIARMMVKNEVSDAVAAAIAASQAIAASVAVTSATAGAASS